MAERDRQDHPGLRGTPDRGRTLHRHLPPYRYRPVQGARICSESLRTARWSTTAGTCCPGRDPGKRTQQRRRDHPAGPVARARPGPARPRRRPGVWLDADEEPESIAGDLDRFQVIAVNFPPLPMAAASAARACCASATASGRDPRDRRRAARPVVLHAPLRLRRLCHPCRPQPGRRPGQPGRLQRGLPDLGGAASTAVPPPRLTPPLTEKPAAAGFFIPEVTDASGRPHAVPRHLRQRFATVGQRHRVSPGQPLAGKVVGRADHHRSKAVVRHLAEQALGPISRQRRMDPCEVRLVVGPQALAQLPASTRPRLCRMKRAQSGFATTQSM